MGTAAGSITRITSVDCGADPGPEAFERFYRQVTDRDDLPTIPEVARRLMVAVNRETTNTKELASLIQRDQSLAAKLLRLANSAFFGMQRNITDIHQAVTLLGFGSVRDLVMTLSLWGAMGDNDPATRRRRKALWAHCAGVGATAKLLAKKLRIDSGESLSAGLLHDVGKLLLGLRLGAPYWEMLDQAEHKDGDLTAVEVDMFGVHHGTIGQYLLQLWGLPQPLSEAVAYHHEVLTPGETAGISKVVNAANRLVDLMAPDREDEAIAILEALAPGKLSAKSWLALRTALEKEQSQIAGFFEDA